MISYVSRRRRWWRLLKKLDDTIELSEAIRGDLMLDFSGLSRAERLMILTSTGNSTEFSKVAQALVDQHAKIHHREYKDKPPRRAWGKP